MKRIIHKILYIYSFLSAGTLITKAQVNPNLPPPPENLRFLNMEADTITNSKALKPFFDKLNQKGGIVSISHIGDSHIQGDYFTQQMRRRFQADYGNAGRGFMFPYQVARTNGPGAYKCASNCKWEVNKIIMPIDSNTNGLAGISISCKEPGSYILFQLRDDSDYLDNTVKYIHLLHNRQTAGYTLKVKDWTNSDSFTLNYSGNESGQTYSDIVFKNPSSQFGIENEACTITGTETIIYGIVTENGQPGILYHAIGVNGAEFKHYNQNPLFFRQTAFLKSNLLIVSMGTNEAQDWKRSNEELIAQINTFIDSLQYYNPGVPILLTTPIESWRGRGRRRGINTFLPRVRMCIMQVSQNRNLAVWDLYTVAGAYKSSLWWRRYKLFSHDMVHNSVAGYRLQGNLMYDAIIKANEQYHQKSNGQ